MARVLLVEPWFSGSHRRWANGYQRTSQHDVSIVSLSEGPWRWRLRAGALPLSADIGRYVSEHGRPDVLLVSGLVDVAQLLGLSRRDVRDVPVAVFQHESQIVYPTVTGNVDAEAVLRNWLSWCAADTVLFNSAFHRQAVIDTLPVFLYQRPEADQLFALDEVLNRFEVMPVGVDLPPASATPTIANNPPVLLWPHRWENDKDPAGFLSALRRLRRNDVPVQLVLAGREPAVPSEVRATILDEFGDWVLAAGPFDRERYNELLAASDVVVSCAKHDFFGVAVVEAIAASCVPVLPNDLAYPEIVPEPWHADALYEPGSFGSKLEALVSDIGQARTNVVDLADTMQRFSWPVIGPQLDAHLTALV